MSEIKLTRRRVIGSIGLFWIAATFLLSDNSRRLLSLKDNKQVLGGIHLGKCGGVSMIRTVHEASKDELGLKFRVAEWFHMKKPHYKKYKGWVVLIRNPVDRLKSLWQYDHLDNLPYRSDVDVHEAEAKGLTEYKHALYNCFHTFDEYTTVGLAPVPYKNSTYCQGIAKRSMMGYGGKMLGTDHLHFNFDFYFNELLDDKPKDDLYVIRQEHMLDDLNRIDEMLEGPAQLQSVKHIDHFTTKELPYQNRDLSDEGLKNLCRFLCTEIQVYKKLLMNAANLDSYSDDVASIAKQCPKETKMSVDAECPWRPYGTMGELVAATLEDTGAVEL